MIQLDKTIPCDIFLNNLSKELQNKYNLKQVGDITMYGISLTNGKLDIQVAFQYLSDKFTMGIKPNGYNVGFTEKDIITNLTLAKVFEILDRKLI